MKKELDSTVTMRVLHFLKTGEYSGAENVAIRIISEMYRKYNVEGIYVSLSGDIDTVLEQNGIEHAIVKKNSKKEYQRVIDMYQPDVIHAHDFGTSVLLNKTKNSARMISHLHNNPPWLKSVNLKTIVFKYACKKYHSILGVSESVLEEFVFNKDIRNNFRVIGNPVDIISIRKMAEESSEIEASDVLFLGRLVTQKNPERFIRIISKCASEKKNIKASMVGKGDLWDYSVRLIQRHNLQRNISLKGFMSNPYGVLKHTKVLCIPSRWEGFGLVAIEAFALGIPVVATPVGGLNDLVTDKCGLISDDDVVISQEILRLLNDEIYYKEKSDAALRRGEELDNLSEYIDTIYNEYME